MTSVRGFLKGTNRLSLLLGIGVFLVGIYMAAIVEVHHGWTPKTAGLVAVPLVVGSMMVFVDLWKASAKREAELREKA